MNHFPLDPTESSFNVLKNVCEEILHLGVRADNGELSDAEYWILTQRIAAANIDLIHAAQIVSPMLTGSERK